MSAGYKSEEHNQTRKLNVTGVISFIFLFVSNICFPNACGKISTQNKVFVLNTLNFWHAFYFNVPNT